MLYYGWIHLHPKQFLYSSRSFSIFSQNTSEFYLRNFPVKTGMCAGVDKDIYVHPCKKASFTLPLQSLPKLSRTRWVLYDLHFPLECKLKYDDPNFQQWFSAQVGPRYPLIWFLLIWLTADTRVYLVTRKKMHQSPIFYLHAIKFHFN